MCKLTQVQLGQKTKGGEWMAGSDQRIVPFHVSKNLPFKTVFFAISKTREFGILVIVLEQNCMKDIWL